MSGFQFGGIIASDKSTCISRHGEKIRLLGWPLVGEWTKDNPELEALRASYADNAKICQDSRGVYLEVTIQVCSITGVRRAERQLAARMYEYLKIGVTIQ